MLEVVSVLNHDLLEVAFIHEDEEEDLTCAPDDDKRHGKDIVCGDYIGIKPVYYN